MSGDYSRMSGKEINFSLVKKYKDCFLLRLKQVVEVEGFKTVGP